MSGPEKSAHACYVAPRKSYLQITRPSRTELPRNIQCSPSQRRLKLCRSFSFQSWNQPSLCLPGLGKSREYDQTIWLCQREMSRLIHSRYASFDQG